MSSVLHRAILDGLRDAPAYGERGILVLPLLEATLDLGAHETLLYQAVYTLVRALPDRLLRGSPFVITTTDAPGGVELAWEGREPAERAAGGGDLRGALRLGPHGDLLDIALLALERFCDARSGFIETRESPIDSASAFPRPPHVLRRVVAFLPTKPEDGAPALVTQIRHA